MRVWVLMGVCAVGLAACTSGVGETGTDGPTSTDPDTDTDTDMDSDTDTHSPQGDIDITNAQFTDRNADCGTRVGTYSAKIRDESEGRDFTTKLVITADDTYCTISGDGLPNHNFGAGGRFAHTTAAVDETFRIPRNPVPASSQTALTLSVDNGVFLGGSKLDILAAACYGIGGGTLGNEKIGCNQAGTPWRYDPMSTLNSFATDDHNAHTQPDGAYHYHGPPLAMYDLTGGVESGVIGYAADGFPIFGPYIDDGGTIRPVVSGYRLKSTNGTPDARVSVVGEGAFPGGDYDGRFIDDYEWDEAAGDLDRCNGMTRDGQYGYYITATFPHAVGCFVGTPDASFSKR